MRATILRILKNGIPTAIALALLGYMMGGLAGMWIESNQSPRTVNGNLTSNAMTGSGNDITQQLRARLPFTMAAWGFALVTVFELIALVPQFDVSNGLSVRRVVQLLRQQRQNRVPIRLPPPLADWR